MRKHDLLTINFPYEFNDVPQFKNLTEMFTFLPHKYFAY